MAGPTYLRRWGATTMYDVTLVDTVGTQLIKFPIATAMINPGNLKQAQIKFVFRKADNSLKSGNISARYGLRGLWCNLLRCSCDAHEKRHDFGACKSG
jgi:hypothetical protein